MNRCRRCRGLVLFSDCHDHERVFIAGRCVNCGDILDAMLLWNRRHRPVHGWIVEEETKRVYHRNLTGKESAYDARH
jgi:hypothetical protein